MEERPQVETGHNLTYLYSALPSGVTLRRLIESQQTRISSITFDASSGTLASASLNGIVTLWDVTSGKLLNLLEGNGDRIYGVAFSPSGKLLAVGSEIGTIKLWDVVDRKLLYTLRADRGPIYSVAFTPDGGMLAGSGKDSASGMGGAVHLWETKNFRLICTLEEESIGPVYGVAFASTNGTLVSGSTSHGLISWNVATRELTQTPNVRQELLYDTTFSPDGKVQASAGADGTVKLWEVPSGKLLRMLEGHTGAVDIVRFTSNGQLLASKSNDDTIRLWSCKTWETVAVVPAPKGGAQMWAPTLAFHHSLPLLITTGSKLGVQNDEQGDTIYIYDLDLEQLLHSDRGADVATAREGRHADNTPSANTSLPTGHHHYRNAKVVLVGNSSVGKSGLGLVLAGRKFRPTESTHGRRIWSLDGHTGFQPTPSEGESNSVPKRTRKKKSAHSFDFPSETRDILLWDLAGQPGYRLVHQLHLHEIAVALVLFDSRSETEPFSGVSYWARALDAARRDFPLKKFLIAARCDRNGPPVSRQRIDAILKRYGFDGFFETSARRGDGIEALQRSLCQAIPWIDLPVVTRSAEFNMTKGFLLEKKKRGMVIEESESLFQGLLAAVSQKHQVPLSRAVFDKCLQQLETSGLLRRLPFGDFVLLQPELLDDYCGWLTQAARKEPDGLGFIPETDARSGKFTMDDDRALAQRKKDEQTLLLATVEESLTRGLAIRATDARLDRTLLVFPAELREELPDYPGGYALTVRFFFHGPVRAIYASLVVRLIYSMEFEKHALHRNAALFKAKHDGGRTCGFAVDYPDIEDDSLGRLTVFFDNDKRDSSSMLFLQYVNSQLEKLAFGGAGGIKRERIYHCHDCDLTIDSLAVDVVRRRRLDMLICSACGRQFQIDNVDEQTQQSNKQIREIDRDADIGQRLAGLATIIQERRKSGHFDLFLCHNSRDKTAVRALANDLGGMGLIGWIDEEQLLPGDVIQQKLEQAIEEAGAVAVCIGPDGLGRWQTVEYHTVYERLIREAVTYEKRSAPLDERRLVVIPVLLPGTTRSQIPFFLRRHLYVDLRRPKSEELKKFAVAVLEHRLP